SKQSVEQGAIGGRRASNREALHLTRRSRHPSVRPVGGEGTLRAARLHAGYVCREIQAPGWERHERMSLLCGAMGSPSGGRLRLLRGRMDAAVGRDAENTSRSVARIKRASAQRVARAAYERLSWIFSGMIRSTYARSGSGARCRIRLSCRYRRDASSVSPGTRLRTLRCSEG